ncbi:hypothetical protein [Hydrogenophaga sp. NFH-34]|uniref:hypothetical protein n=1 Tax=Hydrogenophaga sp. NFH-34 TaxID=2744446 RepID=UPI001F4902C2|nr:hypothetical protein [Hydrogenophaga sp. NFH-34]
MQQQNIISSFMGYLLVAASCIGCAVILTTSRAESRSLTPEQAFELSLRATHGYQVQAGTPRAFLFVDPECAICSEAVAQAGTSPVPTKIVPIAIYATTREKDALHASFLNANTEVFRSIGRLALPLWVAIDGCDTPVIIQGSLVPQDIAALRVDKHACTPNAPKSKGRPNLGAQILML